MKQFQSIKSMRGQSEAKPYMPNSLIDDMTGLWRYSGYLAACEELAMGSAASAALLVLFIDADNLKQVNDTFGHNSGDELIAAITTSLISALPESAVICRKGGDEFLAAAICKTEEDANAMAQSVTMALNRPYEISGHEMLLQCSIGASLEKNGAMNLHEQERRADIAMYWAKHSGKGQLKFFHEEDCLEISMFRSLLSEFPKALAIGELSLAFQPIYRIEDRRILGAEALVRWEHPSHGMIPSERIVETAAKCGRAVDLGTFVLWNACKAALLWPSDRYVSINSVAADFSTTNFAASVLETLREVGFSPSRLRIEITESEMLRLNDIVRSNIDTLRTNGVKLGIDDFGTGHSSMGSIDSFPADFLKIDRSLVSGCENRVSSKIFIKAIKSVAQRIDLELIAEGVETIAEGAIVRGSGIPTAQGFYYSKPIAARELQTLFELPEEDPYVKRVMIG